MKNSIYLVATLVVLAGCKNLNKEVVLEKPVKVATSRVTITAERPAFRYSGTVEASQSIPLNFRTPGTVERVLVDEGDRVVKGQLLATIDNSDLQSLFELNTARYEQALDAHKRLKSVYDEGSLPEIKWIEMETTLKEAKNALEISANNLKKCNLIAPVTGYVGRRNIEPGMSSIASLGSSIEIVDISSVFVKIPVSENEIGKIRKGDRAEIIVSALDNRHFEGTIAHVSTVADRFSRTYSVKIMVENSDHELLPGMVCDVSIKSDKLTNVLVIPQNSATADNSGKPYVYVVDSISMTASKRSIATGRYYGEKIEVIAGLTAGQTIVTLGKEKLTDNCKISL